MKRLLNGILIIVLIIVIIPIVTVLISRNHTIKKNEIEDKAMEEKQSVQKIYVEVNSIQINDEWTDHLRQNWFSSVPKEELTLDSEYGMNAREMDSFCKNNTHYAIIDIQGTINNTSKVTIDCLSYSFSDFPEFEGIWINSDYLFEENIEILPGRIISFCGKALVDLSKHFKEEYILMLKQCGLTLTFRFETVDHKAWTNTVPFVFL